MDVRNKYVDRIRSYYSRSDEKPKVQDLLRKVLKDKRFDSALDIGAGQGELTQVLAERVQKLSIVEIESDFVAQLRTRFPAADIFSHVLYYFPEVQWLDLCKSLLKQLKKCGTLAIIMNTDRGDWWQTIRHFRPKLLDHSAFYYKSWSKFEKELLKIARIQASFDYTYRVSFKSPEDLVDYVGFSCLAISDEATLARIRPEIEKFCKNHFLSTDRDYMEYHARLLMLENNS